MSEAEPGDVPTMTKGAALTAAWRTIAIASFAILLLFLAFIFLIRHDLTASQAGATAFGSLCLWVCFIVTSVATKASIEHLAGPNGGGIKGAFNTLMTDAKPGDPVPPPVLK